MIVRELLARLGVDVDKSAFTKAEDALGRFHLAFEGLRDIVMEARKGLQELLGETAARAHDARRMSEITGMTTDRVQELGYAADVSGVSTEELQHGLVHLSRAAQEAAFGNAEASAAFWQMGVRAADSYGKARPLDQLLGDISAKFHAMPDGPQKAALAMQVFSRGGARMIELLNKGPEGLAELGKEAHQTGSVLGSSAIVVALKYREASLRMKASIEGLRNTIAVGLFPAITKSTEGFARLIASNRKWIALRLHETFGVISRAIQGVLRGLRAIAGLFERVWNSGAVGKGILAALAAGVLAMVAPWAMLAGAIALVAEDIELFFSSHGKAKTVTGLLVATFDLLRKKATGIFKDFLLGWESFKEHPLDFLFEHARAFFKWFVAEAASIPAKIKAALASDEGQKAAGGVRGAGQALQRFGDQPGNMIGGLWKLWGRQLEWLGDRLSGATPASAPGGPGVGPMPPGLEALLAPPPGLSAVRSSGPEDIPALAALLRSPDPGAFFAPQAPVLQPPAQAVRSEASAAPTITFGDVVIHAAPGDDGRKIGDDFVAHVKPQIREIVEDHWNTKMRETAAIVGR